MTVYEIASEKTLAMTRWDLLEQGANPKNEWALRRNDKLGPFGTRRLSITGFVTLCHCKIIDN